MSKRARFLRRLDRIDRFCSEPARRRRARALKRCMWIGLAFVVFVVIALEDA
jgi:hypothetical protein